MNRAASSRSCSTTSPPNTGNSTRTLVPLSTQLTRVEGGLVLASLIHPILAPPLLPAGSRTLTGSLVADAGGCDERTSAIELPLSSSPTGFGKASYRPKPTVRRAKPPSQSDTGCMDVRARPAEAREANISLDAPLTVECRSLECAPQHAGGRYMLAKPERYFLSPIFRHTSFLPAFELATPDINQRPDEHGGPGLRRPFRPLNSKAMRFFYAVPTGRRTVSRPIGPPTSLTQRLETSRCAACQCSAAQMQDSTQVRQPPWRFHQHRMPSEKTAGRDVTSSSLLKNTGTCASRPRLPLYSDASSGDGYRSGRAGVFSVEHRDHRHHREVKCWCAIWRAWAGKRPSATK